MPTSLVDFQAPFDPTAFTQISGAQLLQLIVAAQPYIDKGLVMVEADVNGVPTIPDAITITKWKNYLWLRVSPLTSTSTLYAWNPNQQQYIVYSDGSGSSVLSNWTSVVSGAIPPGSITGTLIAANTILPSNINLSALSTALGFNPATTVTTGTNPTAGNISGSFAAGFSIVAGAVLTAMLADLAVTGAKITNATIDYTKLIGDGTAGDMLKSTGTPAIAPVWFTPLQITTGLSNPNAGGTDDGKLLAVNSGAAGTFKYISPIGIGLGRLVQKLYASINSTSTLTGGAIGADSNNRPYNEGQIVDFLDLAITPLQGTNGSTLFISVNCACTHPGNGYIWIFLYNANGAAVPIGASRIGVQNNGTAEYSINFKVKVVLAASTLITYRLGLGASAANAGVSVKGELSSIEIEEYI